MKTHIIESGVVINTIMASLEDAQQAYPECLCIDGAVGGIGWKWNGEKLTPPAVEATPGELRAALMERATAERWQHEQGGLTLSSGVRVATERDDQNRITSVIANAGLAGVEAVDFKAASGWTTLTMAELRDIAAAIALHVQACFSAERAHHQAIAALATPEELATYDVTAGWPASPV